MRSIFSKIAFLAGVLLALAFTFSCSSDNGDDGGSVNKSSSSRSSSSVQSSSSLATVSSSSSFVLNSSSSVTVISSSSVQGSCSSETVSSSSFGEISSSSATINSSSSGIESSSSIKIEVIHGTPVTYGDETYETVVIGTQIWMARNLNYAVGGSKCYDNVPANCNKYGKLYDWTTAMALPTSCNNSLCASQISVKHKGICPSGWHIPSNDEWNSLINFVGITIAGTKLRSTSDWEPYDRIPTGTDEFGFSALSGGYGYSVGSFVTAGKYGGWWTATEINASIVYSLVMYYSYENVFGNNGGKVDLYSVRCVQD